jgi:acyl dehydratase
VRVIKKVADKLEKQPDRGVLTFETSVVNQNGEPVMVYSDKLMVRRRPA